MCTVPLPGLPHNWRHTWTAQYRQMFVSQNVNELPVKITWLRAEDTSKHFSADLIGSGTGVSKSAIRAFCMSVLWILNALSASSAESEHRYLTQGMYMHIPAAALTRLVISFRKLLRRCLTISQKAQHWSCCNKHLFHDFEFECLGIAQPVHCNQPQNNESLHLRSIRIHSKYFPWTQLCRKI